MAVYIRFIEVHNERIQTNVMAFRNRYPWFSTNMLADGVTELFSDPIGLADSCRDYFNFIIAVLRGNLK